MLRLPRRPPMLLAVAFLASVAIGAGAIRAQSTPEQPPAAVAPDAQGPQPLPLHPPSRVATNALFAGFIATQALDVHSTLRSMDAGNREMNGTVRWATSSPAAFVGVKAATTTATCLLVDRVRRKHPKAAMFLLAGLDTAYTVIVAHNYLSADRSSLAARR